MACGDPLARREIRAELSNTRWFTMGNGRQEKNGCLSVAHSMQQGSPGDGGWGEIARECRRCCGQRAKKRPKVIGVTDSTVGV